ncbi:MAG: metallophosphoesterase [Candidatus Parabeggiatoa sp. nov. 1]|nr:MAG: metallophosphoesterase [Gammaproteobacteria bacterium]
MKLYAISDLHLDHKINYEALEMLPAFPEDWLILAGDICSHANQLRLALAKLTQCFAQLLWVPGNHELWTGVAGIKERGEEKYQQMVSVCRDFGVLTPEDPYPLWQGEGGNHYLVPLFLLYDYSFRPNNISLENAVAWASDSGVVCTDEYYLNPNPYPSRQAWCQARCEYSETRLLELSKNVPLVLINHYPLREDLVRFFTIPQCFSIWCGTRRTENWHLRFGAKVVVSGHLHIRATKYRDGVRFEEVSLGYPKNWNQDHGIQKYLRQILPAPSF